MNYFHLSILNIKIEELIYYFIKIFNHSCMFEYKIYENDIVDETQVEEIFFYLYIFSNENDNTIEFYNNETSEKMFLNLNCANIIYTRMKIINIKSSCGWKMVKVLKNNFFSEKCANFDILEYLKTNEIKLCQPENKRNVNEYVIEKINKLTCKWVINSCNSNFLKKSWKNLLFVSFFDINNNNNVNSFINHLFLSIKENKKELINYKIEDTKIVYCDKNEDPCDNYLNNQCDKIIIILESIENILIVNENKIKMYQGQVLFFDKTKTFKICDNLKLVVINLKLLTSVTSVTKMIESTDNKMTCDLNYELEYALNTEKITIYTLKKCERCVILNKYIPNNDNYKIIYCEKFIENDIKNKTKKISEFILSLSQDIEINNPDLLFPFIFEKGIYVNYDYFLNNIKSNDCYFNNEF